MFPELIFPYSFLPAAHKVARIGSEEEPVIVEIILRY